MMKKNNKKNKGISPVMSAVAGSILGAGVAIAGAIVLSRGENKKKVSDVIKNVKNVAGSFVKKVKNESLDKKEEIQKKLSDEKEVVRSSAMGIVDSIDKLAIKTKKQIKRI